MVLMWASTWEMRSGGGSGSSSPFHVVPRWQGDTNFLTVFADLRSIPEHLKQTYEKLLPYFKKESAHEIH